MDYLDLIILQQRKYRRIAEEEVSEIMHSLHISEEQASNLVGAMDYGFKHPGSSGFHGYPVTHFKGRPEDEI